MKKTVFPLIVILAITSQTVGAQSRYIEGRNSAVGVDIEYGMDKDSWDIGAGVSYSQSGIMDITAGIRRADFDDGSFFSNGVSFGLAFFPLKQTPINPLSFSLFAGMLFENFNSDAPASQSQNTMMFDFGIRVFHEFFVGPAFSFQPSLGIVYVSSRVGLGDSIGGSMTGKDSFIGVEIDSALIFRVSPFGKLALTPSIDMNEHKTSCRVSAVYLFLLP